jgi:hypothetical protein
MNLTVEEKVYYDKICIKVLSSDISQNNILEPLDMFVHSSMDNMFSKGPGSFLTSAQYQCAEHDLNGEVLLTTNICNRVIQRLLDMQKTYLKDSGHQIVKYLDGIKYEWRVLRLSRRILTLSVYLAF